MMPAYTEGGTATRQQIAGKTATPDAEYPKIHPTDAADWLAELAESFPHLDAAARADVLAVARGLDARNAAKR